MVDVLVEAFFLLHVANCVVEVWRELGLGLFGVRKGLTPGVVNLVVPATCEPLAYLSLQAVIVRPAGAADIIGNKGVPVCRQEELCANRCCVCSNPKIRQTTLHRILVEIGATA